MAKYRIISNGIYFKIQTKFFLFFWATLQKPSIFGRKELGGDAFFRSKAEAQAYIDEKLTKPKYTEV